jgi:exodeoxyribonuclease-3
MAYRKKAELILKCYPDLVVVPECEYFREEPTKNLWFGENKKKGIGIFSYSDFKLELHNNYNSSFKYVIPIKVSGPSDFNLLAIWAMNDSEDIRKRYVGQVYSAINYYKELLDKPTIILGDFNWNVIWDANPSYPLYGTLNDIIKTLKNKNIKSAYHEFFCEEFGKETRPTFYMHHDENKPYHIDYCFSSPNFKVRNVEVGNSNDWIKKSDHMPIIITFNDKQLQ